MTATTAITATTATPTAHMTHFPQATTATPTATVTTAHMDGSQAQALRQAYCQMMTAANTIQSLANQCDDDIVAGGLNMLHRIMMDDLHSLHQSMSQI